MLKLSDEALKECKDWLVKASDNWDPHAGGVCKGRTVHLDGVTQVSAVHSACHSWVNGAFTVACKKARYDWNSAYGKDAKNFLVLNCHSKKRSKNVCSAESHEFLVKWIASDDCPLSKYIVNRDDPDSLVNGGVIILCGPDGANVSEAMWICKVLRFCTEGAKAAECFMTLVQGGVDGMLAVLVASFIRTVKGATFGFVGIEAHSSVFGQGIKIDPKQLLNREINPNANSTASLFSSAGADSLDQKTYTYTSVSTIGKKIGGFCKPFKKSDGWGGTISGEGANAKELVAQVLEWQKELGGPLPKGVVMPPTPTEPVRKMPDNNTVYLDLDL